MNRKLVMWSIAVGLGGFLFGLDTAVISGAEQDIQKLWEMSDFYHGLAVAMALYGTIVGAAFGGIPADKHGRKPTLIWIGILFFVSAIGAAVAPDEYTFMLFRFIGGLSIGASSVVAPVYISEIAPPAYRGRLVIAFQFNIVLGILIAYVSNYLLDGVGGDNDWRWMLGVVAIPSLLFSLAMLATPESPRWLLLSRGDEAAARQVIALTRPDTDQAVQEIRESATQTARSENVFARKFNTPVLLAVLFAFFNQVSGINAVIYFAPRIFKMTGLGEEAALLSTAGIGIANLLATILGWYLIDRLGRRLLMYIGTAGYLISLGLIAYSFYAATLIDPANLDLQKETLSNVPLYIFLFIAAHAIGQGSVIWVFISEIFPNNVRASGMALGSLTHWAFAAIIANVFPYFATTLGGGPVFAFFFVMMLFQLLYVWRMMPETKGVSLEDLQKRLVDKR